MDRDLEEIVEGVEVLLRQRPVQICALCPSCRRQLSADEFVEAACPDCGTIDLSQVVVNALHLTLGVVETMGLSASVYLGPYVQCKQRPRTANTTLQTCGTVGCDQSERHLSSKFCPSCGGAVEKRTRTVEATLSHYEVVEDDLTDLSYDSDQILYLGTNHRPPKRQFHSDPRTDELHQILTPELIQEEMEWFHKTYAKQLEKLRAAYDDVQVHWGLHTYVH